MVLWWIFIILIQLYYKEGAKSKNINEQSNKSKRELQNNTKIFEERK